MFTEENKPLLEEAASIDFQFMKNGMINYHKHSKRELGLYFIKKAIEIHGNKYGYSKVTYVNNITKVTIRCITHGDFEQNPHSHLRGAGCPKCANLLKVPTTEDFIVKARGVHGDKYDYSSVHYKGSQEKIEMFCPIPNHGTFFQTPANHLQGNGCPKCAKYDTQEDFILKAVEVHRGKYVYSSVDYLNSKTKVEIFCAVPGHGTFFQTPANHLRGEGCPKCVGQNHNILYLLKCLETCWYKIGITTGNVQKRITSIGGNIEEVYHVKLADPRKHETILHKRYENAREYNLCVKNGNTEFFSLTEEQVKEVIAYMDVVKNG